MTATAAIMRHTDRPIEALDARRLGIGPLDRDLAAKIQAVGVHPFILVRLETNDAGARYRYIHCNTQNELTQFVDELSRLAQSTDLRRCAALSARSKVRHTKRQRFGFPGSEEHRAR